MLQFLVDNLFVVLAGQVFQQTVRISMGTNCIPLLTISLWKNQKQHLSLCRITRTTSEWVSWPGNRESFAQNNIITANINLRRKEGSFDRATRHIVLEYYTSSGSAGKREWSSVQLLQVAVRVRHHGPSPCTIPRTYYLSNSLNRQDQFCLMLPASPILPVCYHHSIFCREKL